MFDKPNKTRCDAFYNLVKEYSDSKKIRLNIEKLSLENNDCTASDLRLIAGASHFAAFCDKFSAAFAYAAGFAAGNKGFFCCFDGNGKNQTVYVDKNHVFKHDDDIFNFFKAELTTFPKIEAVNNAKTELLQRNIPVTTEQFAECVKKNDIESCKIFLKAGFTANELDVKGVPLLCLAARAGCIDMLQFLLDNNADPNLTSKDRGNSAIIDAALGKFDELIELLLKHKADPCIKSKDGQSALVISVGLGDEHSAELLLKAGASADDPDCLGTTARKYAMLLKREKILSMIDSIDSINSIPANSPPNKKG
ncbi:hypothetical protein FACS1894102_6700 [Spirochaetia bacterium]|nr:hypothetical protein FACS1894102_6700 [Spirochaetia bacterium]